MTDSALLNNAVFLSTMALQEGTASTVALLQQGDTSRTFIRAGIPGAAWEAECAMEARGARQGVLVVPVVVDEDSPDELLHIVGVDLDWGLDVYRCLVAKGGDKQVVVGPVERFTGQVQLHPTSPGYVLIQAMRAYSEEEGDDAAA